MEDNGEMVGGGQSNGESEINEGRNKARKKRYHKIRVKWRKITETEVNEKRNHTLQIREIERRRKERMTTLRRWGEEIRD